MGLEPQQRIDAKALPVWRLVGALTSLLYWIIPILYGVLDHLLGLVSWVTWVLAALALCISVLQIIIIPTLRWKRWRYEVNEHELDLKRGVFIIQRTLIPMIRIQHVDTHQGPFLRYYNLSSVTISTAASEHIIPALSNDVADTLRDRISELARVADEDV